MEARSRVHEVAERAVLKMYDLALTRLGIRFPNLRLGEGAFLRSYRESQRHYHDIFHLVQCLNMLARVKGHLRDPVQVVLDILFHYVVYDPRRMDNEEQSVVYWRHHATQLLELRNPRVVETTSRHILLTKSHHVDPDVDPDGALFLDIDMSILGADPVVYDTYAKQVRKEYGHYSDQEWAMLRIELFIDLVLDRVREGRPIFNTRVMRAMLEERAIANLMEERVQLQKLLPA